MRLGIPLACWLALTLVVGPGAAAAPGDLRYFKTYPEAATSGYPAQFNAAAVQPDGKVVLAGFGYQAASFNNPDWVVARIDPATGDLDPAFGQGGVVKLAIDLVPGGLDTAHAVATGPGGRILVAGDAQPPGNGWDMAVVALTAAGERDTGFGPNGLRTVAFGPIDRAGAVAVAADGTVTLGGLGDGKFALARLDATGEPLGGFGAGGKVTTAVGGGGGYDEIADLVLSGTDVIAAGTADRSTAASEVALVRYDAAGNPAATKVVAGAQREEAVDALLAGGQVVVGYDRRDVNTLAPATATQALDATTLEPVGGFGADTFGDPSLFGGLAANPAGGFLAAGLGPFGGSLDDMRLAFLGTDGKPAGEVFNYPSSADKQEFANALAFVPAAARRAARQGATGGTAVLAGSQADVPAVAAVATDGTTTTPPPPPQGLKVPDLQVFVSGGSSPFGRLNTPRADGTLLSVNTISARITNLGEARSEPAAAETTVNGDNALLEFGQDFGPPGEPCALGLKAPVTTKTLSRTCTVPALDPGEYVDIGSVGATFKAPGRLSMTARVACLGYEGNCANNVDSKTSTLIGPDYRHDHSRFDRFTDRMSSFRLLVITGQAEPEDDPTGARASASRARVEVAVLRVDPKGAKAAAAGCRWLASTAGRFRTRPVLGSYCAQPVWLRAKGTRRWSLRLRKRLPRGRYVLYTRAINKAGKPELVFSKKLRNRLQITLR